MFTTEREGERETIAKQDGKRGYCNIFATRESPHADVLYDEYHEPEKPGTVNRKEYDEDKPGGGKFYCKVTGRHFESALALKNHTKTKRYKKLKKQLLMGPKPHNQRDAEAAAGMAPPTNS